MRRHGPRTGVLSPRRTAAACRALRGRHRRALGRAEAVVWLGPTPPAARPATRTPPTRMPRIRSIRHSVRIIEDGAANGATGCHRENSMLRGDRTAPEQGADFDTSRAGKIAHLDNLAVEQGGGDTLLAPAASRAGASSPAESSARQPKGPTAVSTARSSATWREIRCHREGAAGTDCADSSADMPCALSQHDFGSDFADARAARGRS